MTNIRYTADEPISTEQFIGVLEASGLAERRPTEDKGCISEMLQYADLLVTAWRDAKLVGVARTVTDFSYCAYLSDLAVDRTCQSSGIGRHLIRHTRQHLGPRCTLILLSAPAAVDYYPKVGFERHPQAWIMKP
ncbi:MAG: GNAT family N-acetyltransferase, partial [Thermoanaerobaculia bacterium]|nr:GNAT family N-acetyltransferase [Thermoanaerobaculia bacterium]